MALEVRERKQRTISFSSNNKETDILSRGMIYRELYLRLAGTLTVDGTDNTRANTELGDEWAVVKKIEIIANGTDVIKSISGNALWWLNYFMYGQAPRITPAIGGGADAPAFDSVLILPFWMRDGRQTMDTALDSRSLSSLEIAVTWGSFTDINATATAFGTAPTLDVYSNEVFNLPLNVNFANWRVFEIEKTITATTPEFEIDLPIGGTYRGFMVETTDADVDQGDILNNLKLVSGTTVYFDLKAQDDILAQVSPIRRGLSRSYDLGGNVYQPLRKGTHNSIDGWYWVDIVQDGLLTESVDTLGLSEIKLKADVTVGGGTTKIRVWPMQIFPVRGGNNG